MEFIDLTTSTAREGITGHRRVMRRCCASCAGRRRRGAIFLLALGIIVILSGMLLVFAQNMRTEALSAANRVAYVQADAVEQGAEKWVLAQVESYPADAVTITQTPAEAIQIGNGYFWILHPDPTTDQQYGFGIVDESSKLNINKANPAQTVSLPGMTEDIADSIYAWANPAGAGASNGAQSDYYESLAEPYEAKNQPFETVEELLLVKDLTSDLLYGYDLNHDGVLDAAEQAQGGMGSIVNSGGTDTRGLFNYVTCYSAEPNTAIDGSRRVNVNGGNTQQLQSVLTTAGIANDRAMAIVNAVIPLVGRGRNPFGNLGQFVAVSGMKSSELKLVADNLTASNQQLLTGLVNVNTAPKQVLQCLTGDEGDADTLIGQRSSASDTSSYAWIFDALTPQKAAALSSYITARSYQYSADIVAVSGDGRSFKRVRIVVDSRTLPAKIVYRRDLTSLGWPLPVEIRRAMRAGQGVPDAAGGMGSMNAWQ